MIVSVLGQELKMSMLSPVVSAMSQVAADNGVTRCDTGAPPQHCSPLLHAERPVFKIH